MRRITDANFRRAFVEGPPQSIDFCGYRRDPLMVGARIISGAAMSFYGSIVLSRSETLLPLLPTAQCMGYRHSRLRELGGGWQVMQAGGWNDPPDMVAAVDEMSRACNEPVLAAYVADTCVQLHTAIPAAAVTSAHLPDPQLTVDCGMLHRPEFTGGCSYAQVCEEVQRWAAQAGLRVSPERLKRTIEYDYEDGGEYLASYEQVYELVHALGFDEFPAEVAPLFDPESEPFWRITASYAGIAARARRLAVEREYRMQVEPEAPWEAKAIRLQLDVHAAKYDPAASLRDLIVRCQEVQDEYRAATADDAAPEPEISIGGRPVTNPEYLAQELMRAREQGILLTGHIWPDQLAGRGRWPGLHHRESP
jgi:hypothetical protein